MRSSTMGIPPDMTERIFDRLQQVATPSLAARKGLGLGLFICKELVTLQGGEIWAQTGPGRGSMFSLTLPLFSLNTLIGPLLRNDAWPARWIGLLSVEISSHTGWLSSEKREEWCRKSRSLIQSCLLPNLDVLVPKMNSGVAEETFFVVVFADDFGGAVLAKRIREQFGQNDFLTQAGLTLSVSYKLLGPTPIDAAASFDETVGKMGARLAEHIKSEIHTRSIHGE
jgi:hypothetical protein